MFKKDVLESKIKDIVNLTIHLNIWPKDIRHGTFCFKS